MQMEFDQKLPFGDQSSVKLSLNLLQKTHVAMAMLIFCALTYLKIYTTLPVI